METDEINPDDFEFDNYDKGEESSGTSTHEGSVLFTWKGKEYELEIDVYESWDKRGDYEKSIEITDPQPKDISDDEWEQIVDWVREEVSCSR